MDLARGAKLHLGYATAYAARALFDRWWERARAFCAEHDADTAWFKFARGFELARTPLVVSDLASTARDAAKRGPLPKAADRFRTERMRLLVGICWHMKRLTGGPFKLSCHPLARLFDAKPAQAWEWLRALERELVIRCIDRGRGGAASRKAATFEYVGDDLMKGWRPGVQVPVNQALAERQWGAPAILPAIRWRRLFRPGWAGWKTRS